MSTKSVQNTGYDPFISRRMREISYKVRELGAAASKAEVMSLLSEEIDNIANEMNAMHPFMDWEQHSAERGYTVSSSPEEVTAALCGLSDILVEAMDALNEDFSQSLYGQVQREDVRNHFRREWADRIESDKSNNPADVLRDISESHVERMHALGRSFGGWIELTEEQIDLVNEYTGMVDALKDLVAEYELSSDVISPMTSEYNNWWGLYACKPYVDVDPASKVDIFLTETRDYVEPCDPGNNKDPKPSVQSTIPILNRLD